MEKNHIAIENGETINVLNFNFLNTSSINLVSCESVKKIIIKQDEDAVPSSDPYAFYQGMIKFLNCFVCTEHLVIENFHDLEDDYFSGLNLKVWNNLLSLKIRKCPKVGTQLFSWIADNCKSLVSFELSCRYFINPNYLDSQGEKEIYYELNREDLIRFFTNNQNTLKKVMLQVKQLIWNEQPWYENVFDTICKCSKLENISIFIGEEDHFYMPFVLTLFKLPSLDHFVHYIKLWKVVHLEKVTEHGVESSSSLRLYLAGSLEHRDDTFATFQLNRMFECLHNRLMHLFLSRIDGVSAQIIGSIANNNTRNLRTVKLINCGLNFNMEHLNYLTATCSDLKVLVVFEASALIGISRICVLVGGVVLVVVKDGIKLLHQDLRHFKNRLGESEYFWLEEEGTSEDERGEDGPGDDL
jgi:hypothetical protein